MSRLTRQFISQEGSNVTTRQQLPTKPTPVPVSTHITSKINNKANIERMPGYVKPYTGKSPTGYLNTPSDKKISPIINDQQSIEKYIRDLATTNNTNTQETKNKLLVMRKIALHNNRVMNEKLKSERTQLKFQ
jgi:hypothetical protein